LKSNIGETSRLPMKGSAVRAGRGVYHATPAVTWDPGVCAVSSEGPPPFSRLFEKSLTTNRGYKGPIII
jgi:hypothetical protein